MGCLHSSLITMCLLDTQIVLFLCLPEQFVLLPSGGHKQINRALKEAEAACGGAPVSTSEQTDLHLIYQHSQSHYSLYINCDAYCAQGLGGFEGAASSTK